MTSGAPTSAAKALPLVGIGYRRPIDGWIRANLGCFDVIEITVDHCLSGSPARRAAIFELVGEVPLLAHGVGLSIGTDAPLDLAYVDRVAAVVERLRAPFYSEHLAFTRVPGRNLANLLPLPKTRAVAELIIAKVRELQARLPVPFLLENIAYLFDWPDTTLSDAEFIISICEESGAGLLLDVENVFINARNHGFDSMEFLDCLPHHLVKQLHIAGGMTIRGNFASGAILADTHSEPAPDGALVLLDRAVSRFAPAAIILERDERLEATDEILDDIARIRARLTRATARHRYAEATVGAPD